MSATILRTLTVKSKLKFGKYKDYTVEHIFGMRKQKTLISIYFNLSNITFMDDILDELGITEEFRIDKPSKDRELYNVFLLQTYGKKLSPIRKLEGMKRESKSPSNGYLTRLNHGHR